MELEDLVVIWYGWVFSNVNYCTNSATNFASDHYAEFGIDCDRIQGFRGESSTCVCLFVRGFLSRYLFPSSWLSVLAMIYYKPHKVSSIHTICAHDCVCTHDWVFTILQSLACSRLVLYTVFLTRYSIDHSSAYSICWSALSTLCTVYVDTLCLQYMSLSLSSTLSDCQQSVVSFNPCAAS